MNLKVLGCSVGAQLQEAKEEGRLKLSPKHHPEDDTTLGFGCLLLTGQMQNEAKLIEKVLLEVRANGIMLSLER